MNMTPHFSLPLHTSFRLTFMAMAALLLLSACAEEAPAEWLVSMRPTPSAYPDTDEEALAMGRRGRR